MDLLGDDAVTLILLKLDLESLIRATACCRRWLSLVCSNATFLLHYRTLHGPVLGFAGRDKKGRHAWGCAFGAGKYNLFRMKLPRIRDVHWKHAAFSNRSLNIYYYDKLMVYRRVGSGWEKHKLPVARGLTLTPQWYGQPSWLLGMKLYMEVEEETSVEQDDQVVHFYIKAYDILTGADLGVRIPSVSCLDARTGLYETEDNKLMAVSTRSHSEPHVEVFLLEKGEWRKTVEVNYNLPAMTMRSMNMFPVGATEKCVVVRVNDEVAVYDMAKQAWSKLGGPGMKLGRVIIVDQLELFQSRTLDKLDNGLSHRPGLFSRFLLSCSGFNRPVHGI